MTATATATLINDSSIHSHPQMTAPMLSPSLPTTRVSSPAFPARTSTPPAPPPPPSRAIPTDFKSSLAAWWNNSSYKEARLAEERLLRRLPGFQPAPPAPAKGWFGWSSSSNSHLDVSATAPPSAKVAGVNGTVDSPAISTDMVEENAGPGGLRATLRNVFIPTPDPTAAPAHPADPRIPSAPADSVDVGSPSSSSASLTNGPEKRHKHHHHQHKAAHQKKHVDYLNTLEISSAEDANSKEGVVVLHGYAAAMGFFFRNWSSISHSSHATGRRTFFLDWLGMGLSSRPSPNLLASPANSPVPSRVARAEHFFLSSLEAWREQVGLEKMVLVGHSLGGYLASAYAVRYPERVSGLVLVSPAGVPRGPEYQKYKLSSQQGGTTTPTEEEVDAAEMELGASNEPKGEAKQWRENRENSAFRRNAMKFFVWGWERGISPFSFLRVAGPFGPLWASKYTTRRFANQSEEDIRDIHAYIYNTSILKGSGEYCISHILAPGAYARVPIVDRIHNLKVPVTFLYGDNDWMDVDGGHASVEALKKAGNNNASVHVVPKAGHHLYLDNPERTNKLLDDAIKALPRPAV